MLPEDDKYTDDAEENKRIIALPHDLKKSIGIMFDEFQERTAPEAKRETMRGTVTSRIVWMYVICVAVIIFSGAAGLLFSKSPDQSAAIIESLRSLVDFFHALVLPIITLVLGFYFGSEKR